MTFEGIQSLNNLNHKKTLWVFILPDVLFPKNTEELEYLLHKTKIDFDVIVFISESRITWVSSK